jgi:hypothetical protein
VSEFEEEEESDDFLFVASRTFRTLIRELVRASDGDTQLLVSETWKT